METSFSFFRRFVIILPTLLVGGCSTPFMIQHGGQKHLAPALGLEEIDIRYLHYAFFNDQPTVDKPGAVQGMVSVTKGDLYLIKGNLSTISPGSETRVPIKDIEGLHSSEGQIQLKVGEETMVIWVVTSRNQHDEGALKDLNDLLVSDGVPAWQSNRTLNP